MALTRKVLNLKTGKTRVIPLTPAEEASAVAASKAERIQKRKNRRRQRKQDAINAELEALVDPMTGTTDEAIAYQEDMAEEIEE